MPQVRRHPDHRFAWEIVLVFVSLVHVGRSRDPSPSSSTLPTKGGVRAATATLRDRPLLGDGGLEQLLDTAACEAATATHPSECWTAASPEQGLRIPASVPGDVISDLQRAHKIPDPCVFVRDTLALWPFVCLRLAG